MSFLLLCNAASAAAGASARAGNNMAYLAHYTLASCIETHTHTHADTHLCPHYAGGNLILSQTNPLPYTHTRTHDPLQTHTYAHYTFYIHHPPKTPATCISNNSQNASFRVSTNTPSDCDLQSASAHHNTDPNNNTRDFSCQFLPSGNKVP